MGSTDNGVGSLDCRYAPQVQEAVFHKMKRLLKKRGEGFSPDNCPFTVGIVHMSGTAPTALSQPLPQLRVGWLITKYTLAPHTTVPRPHHTQTSRASWRCWAPLTKSSESTPMPTR